MSSLLRLCYHPYELTWFALFLLVQLAAHPSSAGPVGDSGGARPGDRVEVLAALTGAPKRVAQQMAYCLRESSVAEIAGKQGNALLYRRTER